MNKNLLVAVAVTALSIGAISPLVASADTNSGQNTIADKIATKFNLNKDEVQKVFDEEHAARNKEMEQNYKDKLAEAVKNGKITQEQADKIQQKHTEIEAERDKNREAFKNMSHDERHAAMEKKRAELEQWAKDNGIDEQYLRPSLGGHGPGRNGPHDRGEN